MDLDRLLELNNNYHNSHNKIVNLLQSILEKGELTEGDYEEIQDSYSKNEDNFNELDKAENDYMKSDLELQLEILKNTKIDLNVDSVLDLLTNGGRTSAIFKDENGNIMLDAARIEELNQVKVQIDENNKRIASIVADTEVEQEDGSKIKLKVLFSTLDQRVDSITTTVGEIEGTANSANDKAESALTKASQAVQTSEKFEWIVKEGSTQSSITLTDEAILAIANSNLVLKATQITLEGIVTANGNFKILSDGSIEATNANITGKINATSGKISSDLEVEGMNVSGNLSTDTLNVRKINCPNLAVGVTEDVNITVNPSAGNVTDTFGDNAVFSSLQTCIESIPNNLNGYTVTITVISQISENITIRGFNGGVLNIRFKANCLGYIAGYNCSAQLLFQGTGSSNAIKPSTLVSLNDRYYATAFKNCSYVLLDNMEIYGKTNNPANWAVGSECNSFVKAQSLKITASENGFTASNGGRIYEKDITGKVNSCGQNAKNGGIIHINDGTILNGSMSKDNSSQIICSSSGAVQDTSSTVGTNTNTTTTATNITMNSTGGNSYRHNVYTGWKNDNTCRQGDYGYGDCDGIWLFGTQFTSKLQGKNVTKITLTVTRQQGGIYGAVTSTLKMHNHSTRPAGAPTYVGGWSKTFSLAVNSTTTITITDSAVLTAIKNGTCKGFGLQGAYDSSHYAVFSGNCTLTATIQ